MKVLLEVNVGHNQKEIHVDHIQKEEVLHHNLEMVQMIQEFHCGRHRHGEEVVHDNGDWDGKGDHKGHIQEVVVEEEEDQEAEVVRDLVFFDTEEELMEQESNLGQYFLLLLSSLLMLIPKKEEGHLFPLLLCMKLILEFLEYLLHLVLL